MQRVWCSTRLGVITRACKRFGQVPEVKNIPFQLILTNFRRNLVVPKFTMAYTPVEFGTLNTLDYRIYFKAANGNFISPFHDIPLYADKEKNIFNMVVEIPKWTNHKMELNKEEKLNPMKQDVKSGKIRFVKNFFPHHGYIWNYGAFPQTWEDPNFIEPETGTKGDKDPLDVCEIGNKVHKRGAVIQVKVLGIMCLIDEGETDWKVLCIDVNDPNASKMNDIEDVERLMPGFLRATFEWFSLYKVPDGKEVNKFAFGGDAKKRDYTIEKIIEAHEQWKKLIGKEVDCLGIACENVTVGGSPYRISQEDAQHEVGKGIKLYADMFNLTIVKQPELKPAAPLPDDVDVWHFIDPKVQMTIDDKSKMKSGL
ncbi:hypothetical protein ACJMK2_035088 [Sinanodonta woodiana]|uniref:Inorganic pyrophosphatase n=1 Tax=Sinanodonta woodiana TaxID=1069815 RepID=A0ABD3WV71_SINWO